MLLVGRNILSKEDALQKFKVESLYYGLRNPKPEIESRIRQLRIIRDLDTKQYSQLKKQLPYIVCGIFNPPFRRTENFAYIEYFMLDIDCLSQKGLSLQQTRDLLQKDNRVVLCFTSPSEDGLKLLFRLNERCYDAGLYSLFYKAFVKQFSIQYQLQQVVDSRTSDVCRACFISIDSNAYYNEQADPVDINAFLEINNPEALFNLKHKLDVEQSAQEEKKEVTKESDLDDEVLTRIKALLNPKGKKVVPNKNVYVPEILEDLMTDLRAYIEQTGMIVTEVRSIQYGKKIRMKTGIKQAEINVFYGRRGFSVVQSPRNGTSEKLNNLMAEMINDFLSAQ
jgi:hypothetical protein